MNFIYKQWFYEKDLQKYSPILNLVTSIPNDADIIYIGESSNTTARGNDIDKRPISDFVGDHFPDLNTYHITKPASHAGIYKVLLEKIPEENNVKTVIVTLNLRSFNAQWIYSGLETSLQKSLVLIKPYPPLLNRFFLSFKAYDIKTKKERTEQFKSKWKNDEFNLPFEFEFNNVIEWDGWMFHNGFQNENGERDQAKVQLACHYIKTYGFQLDTTNNPRISDFNDIIKLSEERGWNLAFNLLAENTEKAKELVGDDLIYIMNENTKKLIDYYTNRGVLVINNLNEVEDEQYIDQHWTTEHYAEKGRKTVAKNVASALKVWHGDFFEKVNYNNTYQTVFFNDCDNNAIWGQMQTITSEKAFSGNKSSKTGDGNDYSITLEYPFNIIPDSLKENITTELWAYQESLDHNAKLIIQANGQNTTDFWYGVDLKNDSTKINTWEKHTVTVTIPNNIKNAELIKVYVYNPSKENVFIDNFKVRIDEL